MEHFLAIGKNRIGLERLSCCCIEGKKDKSVYMIGSCFCRERLQNWSLHTLLLEKKKIWSSSVEDDLSVPQTIKQSCSSVNTQENWKNLYAYRNLQMNVQSSLIHHIQRVETIQMSFNWQLVEMWFIHTVDYYSPIKRNEVLTHAATWMNPENIVPSKSI